ncbi:hypothetical protein MSAN_00448600 [Mycena sanguinolenta]|uniref:Uncharacterized protein n=1 Tax=Mycena sanguinolenta TaxID=230812 RepID=A0A8H6ZAP4_9AGAR|nr:hypothetical protein MSAN_00448600 [Mycena sanguinolenta]
MPQGIIGGQHPAFERPCYSMVDRKDRRHVCNAPPHLKIAPAMTFNCERPSYILTSAPYFIKCRRFV